jgi:pyruvate kinase
MRQCLSYRGVIPIMADLGLDNSVELLEYAINYAKTKGLVKAGERVVVSKCPRKGYSDIMDEAGVVILLQVDDA